MCTTNQIVKDMSENVSVSNDKLDLIKVIVEDMGEALLPRENFLPNIEKALGVIPLAWIVEEGVKIHTWYSESEKMLFDSGKITSLKETIYLDTWNRDKVISAIGAEITPLNFERAFEFSEIVEDFLALDLDLFIREDSTGDIRITDFITPYQFVNWLVQNRPGMIPNRIWELKEYHQFGASLTEEYSPEDYQAFLRGEYLPYPLCDWEPRYPALQKWGEGETLKIKYIREGRYHPTTYALRRARGGIVLDDSVRGIPTDVMDYARRCLEFSCSRTARKNPWKVVKKGHHIWVQYIEFKGDHPFERRGTAVHESATKLCYCDRAIYNLDFIEIVKTLELPRAGEFETSWVEKPIDLESYNNLPEGGVRW